MLKLLCVFAVSFAVIYAQEKKAEISSGRIIKGKEFPGLTITTNGDKTEFTWKEPTNAQINPLRATFSIRFTKTRKSEYADLDNLCGDFKKGTLQEKVKEFALKTIANVDNCPIMKDAKATFKAPSTYSFTSDNNKCGPYRSELKIFKKSDKDNAHPIVTGMFQGNITGCK